MTHRRGETTGTSENDFVRLIPLAFPRCRGFLWRKRSEILFELRSRGTRNVINGGVFVLASASVAGRASPRRPTSQTTRGAAARCPPVYVYLPRELRHVTVSSVCVVARQFRYRSRWNSYLIIGNLICDVLKIYLLSAPEDVPWVDAARWGTGGGGVEGNALLHARPLSAGFLVVRALVDVLCFYVSTTLRHMATKIFLKRLRSNVAQRRSARTFPCGLDCPYRRLFTLIFSDLINVISPLRCLLSW